MKIYFILLNLLLFGSQANGQGPVIMDGRAMIISDREAKEISESVDASYDPAKDYRVSEDQSGKVHISNRAEIPPPEVERVVAKFFVGGRLRAVREAKGGWICSVQSKDQGGQLVWIDGAGHLAYTICSEVQMHDLVPYGEKYLSTFGDPQLGQGGVNVVAFDQSKNRFSVEKQINLKWEFVLSACLLIPEKNVVALHCGDKIRIQYLEQEAPYLMIKLRGDQLAGSSSIASLNGDLLIGNSGVCWLLRRDELYFNAIPVVPVLR